MSPNVVDALLASSEPSIRYKTLVHVIGQGPAAPTVHQLHAAVRKSSRVQMLLSARDEDGHIPHHPYAKWYGAHWVLATLADIGHPAGDQSLSPLRDDVLAWLLGDAHRRGIKTIQGRTRRCASQEGYAVYYLLKLGLSDGRVDELAARLRNWQWEDGGWNCDKNPAAVNSSFMESLIPLRGLALHAQMTGNHESREAVARAAEIFLKRKLYRLVADGTIMRPDFVRLHYPCYWHYDILFGLKVMAEVGFIHDPRCHDALDLLESKQLPDGGFSAEERYYRITGGPKTGYSLVDWGGTSVRHMNEWVTVDALYVLRASGRWAC